MARQGTGREMGWSGGLLDPVSINTTEGNPLSRLGLSNALCSCGYVPHTSHTHLRHSSDIMEVALVLKQLHDSLGTRPIAVGRLEHVVS